MESSVEQAFSILGLTTASTLRDLRRRYASLARQWHPDRVGSTPQLAKEATVRMAEINAAYQVAREHLRRQKTPSRGPTAAAAGRRPTGSAGVGYVRPWSIWEHEPGTHEWRGLCAVKGLAMAVAIAGTAEALSRALPSEWSTYVWLVAVMAIAVGAIHLLRQARE